MRMNFHMPAQWAQRAVRIALIGAGGTGSDMAVRLAKMHRQLVALGGEGLDVTIFDPDAFSANNVGRQHASPSFVGLNKALALCHSLNMAYALNWRGIPQAFDVERAKRGYNGFDLIVTCVDKALFRAELGRSFRDAHTDTLWLDTGNGADLGQVVLGPLGTPYRAALRLPNVFDLWPDLATMQAVDVEQPSCSAEESMTRQSWPVNQAAALVAAEMLWTLIRHGSLDYHGTSFHLRPLRTEPMWIDPEAWSFFGYAPERAEAAGGQGGYPSGTLGAEPCNDLPVF